MTDNAWRLYNTQRPELAEQTFELTGLRSRRLLGLGGWAGPDPGSPSSSSSVATPTTGGGGLGGSTSAGSRSVAAFAFGAGAAAAAAGTGWEQFSVLFLTAGGEVFSLCPVVPFGIQLGGRALQDLQAAAAAAVDEEGAEGREQRRQRQLGWGATTEAWLQRAFQPVAAAGAFAAGEVAAL